MDDHTTISRFFSGLCVMRRRTGTSAPSAHPVQLMAAKISSRQSGNDIFFLFFEVTSNVFLKTSLIFLAQNSILFCLLEHHLCIFIVSWKYGKTAEIISKVTVERSLTNPNNNLILLFEFSKLLVWFISQNKISLGWRNTHNVSSLIAKTVTAFQHKRWQDVVKCLTPTRTWKCTRSTMQISYLYTSDFPFKIEISSNSHKQVERIRNNRKQKLVLIKHCSEKLTN